MEQYRNFIAKLNELKDKRVRICFFLPEIARYWTYIGQIKYVDEKSKSLVFDSDPQVKGEFPITKSHFNLESTVIYAIDELDPEAVLSEEDKPEYAGDRTEYIPYDKEGNPIREPQKGYVILHKDHIYAKGTVYTKLPEHARKEAEE